MQLHRRWPIDWRIPEMRQPGHPTALLVPDFPIPKGLSPQWASLLPTTDYNKAMLAGLVRRPSWAPVPDIATCYMADPFLNGAQFARALHERGISRVANLPSAGMFGADYAALLNKVSLGFDRELQRLALMAQHQLEVFIAVANFEQARRAMVLRPTALIAVAAPVEDADPDPLPVFCRRWAQEQGAGQLPILALSGERESRFDGPVSGTVQFGLH